VVLANGVKKGDGVVMTSARMGVRGEVGWRNNRTSLNNSGTDHSFLLPPPFLHLVCIEFDSRNRATHVQLVTQADLWYNFDLHDVKHTYTAFV